MSQSMVSTASLQEVVCHLAVTEPLLTSCAKMPGLITGVLTKRQVVAARVDFFKPPWESLEMNRVEYAFQISKRDATQCPTLLPVFASN